MPNLGAEVLGEWVANYGKDTGREDLASACG